VKECRTQGDEGAYSIIWDVVKTQTA